ncbi:MAG: DMT family transporter [Boseongicola sp.]|nr:DMT family transporter [Boseongicola sp.]NNJ67806.1 DMT family transporter [Boseongicola sp.]
MELWVILAIAAALAQTFRFALQKVLAGSTLSTAAATWARFLWSAPVVIAIMAAYVALTPATLPSVTPAFWPYALAGGATQILATICTVALFKRRAFAVGITFKKTEVMLTAIAGLLILGDHLDPLGAAFIALGFVAVLLLSEAPEGGGIFNKGAAIGLLSGVFFALSAVGYRGALLAMDSDNTFLVAGLTLAFVASAQAIALGLWLALREPGQITETLKGWRKSSLVGVFSLIGSWCWFAAFSLQNAAYVFAVGQIELIFSLAMGVLFFREKTSARELFGMALLTVSITAVALIGSS